MKHPKKVLDYNGSIDDLAKAIENMTYDQTSDFIKKLSEDIERQADGDFKKGRKKLAKELYETAKKLNEAHKNMSKAWKICEPYMKE